MGAEPRQQGPITITEKPEWREVRLVLQVAELERLEQLATVRGTSVQNVIRQFARTCQPSPDVSGRAGTVSGG